MNSHLFNPFRGTRATLERLKLLDASDCDRAIIESDPSTLDAATLAKRQALKDAMTAAKFATDPVANGQGTAEHIVKILDAAATSQVVTYEEGGKLVSQKLPLDVLVSAGADPQLATQLSTDTVNAINAIVVAAPGYASTATGCTEAQKLLTGGVSRADQVQSRVQTLLHDLNFDGDTQLEDTAFGVYGELPVLVVSFPDGFILLDATNGNVSSPYKPGERLDPNPLLLAHSEYGPGSGSRGYGSAAGCLAASAPDWYFSPPAGFPGTCYTQVSRVPFFPTAWTCVTVKPSPVSRFTNPFPTLTTACWCEQETMWVWNGTCGPTPPPGQGTIKVKEVCQYMGPCYRSPMSPFTPTTLLPGPSPTVTVTCWKYYWY